MSICFKFPSRSRPEKFFKALDNIVTLTESSDYIIVATLDTDDLTMNNETVIQRMDKYSKLKVIWGTSTGKINAVNRDLNELPPYDILVLMSDDMEFAVKGFDLEIIKDMQTYFPDKDGLLHYPDGYANQRLVTMPILGYNWVRHFKYIYHPDYVSLYCDNEQMEVAIRVDRYKYLHKNLFIHQHPAWGAAPMDDQYRLTESYMDVDRTTFHHREKHNFDLDIPILSILITALPNRDRMLNSLLLSIEGQRGILPFILGGPRAVEVLVDHGVNVHTGTKRNALVQRAKGSYIVFIDDDDEITPEYIPSIMEAIINNPDVDCIGINGWMTSDGADRRDWFISKEYGHWYTNEHGQYMRTPNHISPVKTSIARQVPFPDITYGEDYAYSMGIFPLLKTEAKVNKQIYHYKWMSQK